MSANNEFVMSLDAGTGAARCFVISLDGRTSYESYQEWQYTYPPEAQPGGAEFDPQAFWQILVQLIRRVLSENRLKGEQIVGISSTCQREGIVLLDRDGQELYGGPNIDMRAPSGFQKIAEKFGDEIYKASGHWPFPMFAPYRLLWFKEHHPNLYEQIDGMLLINDWILYRLSNEKAGEPSNSNETLLLNLSTCQWNTGLIERLDLPKNIYPQVVPSGTCIGRVTPSVAKETGLRTGTAVVTGGADTQCALLGTGSIEEGQISTVLGTFAPSQMVVSRPIIDQRRRAWSGCHIVPDRWVVESTAMEAGQALRWVRDVFYSESTAEYAQIDREASSSPIGARGVQALIGPRVPDYTRLKFDVRGGFFFNLPPAPGTTKRADFARSVIESVAFGVKANIERIKSITAIPINSLSICGGMSKSVIFPAVYATVMNHPVRIPVQKEGSAMGAAICAAVGSQRMKDFAEATAEMIHWESERNPEPEWITVYEDLYCQWLPLLEQVHGSDGLGEIE